MKLKIFSAAALATLAWPALAQSSVTLYGNLDLGLLSISSTSGGTGYLPSPINNGSSKQLKDGGLGASNWGIKGTEDLGDGLQALFQLQGNLAVDTGAFGGPNSGSTTSLWNQMAVVGLSGRFGMLRLGRQVSPMYWAMATTDARTGRYFGSVLTGLVGLNSASGTFVGDNSNPAFGTVYNDNAIVYTSPGWNDMTINLELALGEVGGSLKANSQQAVTAVYDDSHLKLSALFYNGYGNNLPDATLVYTKQLGSAAAAGAALSAKGLTSGADTNRLASIGALYTWDAWTVSTSWFDARNPSRVQVLPVGSTHLNMWSLGAGWKIQPVLNLTGGYYRITDKINAGNTAAQFALGLEYYLSKRTILYAEAASVTNHGANMNLSPVYASAVAANQSVRAAMLGLRHVF
jgi:predicted porin